MAIRHLRLLQVRHDGSQHGGTQSGAALHEPGGDYESLHRQFKRLFNARPGKAYGRFTEDIGQHPFSSWLLDYLDGRQDFERFSDHVLKQWEELVTAQQAEVDSPLLLVHESLADGEVIYLFALETEATLQLDGDLALQATETISQSRLNLAARIELEDWRGEHPTDSYLTLLQGRGTGERGKLFGALIGFQSNVDVDAETRTFMEAVESFARDQDPEQAQTVRTRAYEFCREQEALGEPVPVSALSGYLNDEQPEQFAHHAAQSQSLSPDTVLHPDRRRVRKLVRLSGKGNGMSLSFSSDLLNQAVHYDTDQDALIITRVPRSLKEQLQNYLDRQNEQ